MNPNTYNDAAFVEATHSLQDAVDALWNAGAEKDDIRSEVDSCIENAEQDG